MTFRVLGVYLRPKNQIRKPKSLMKNTLSRIVMTTALVVVSALFSSFTNTANDKITICHIPPGNVDNCHEITISMNALQTHLNHHDTFYCGSPEEYYVVTDLIKNYESATGALSPVQVLTTY